MINTHYTNIRVMLSTSQSYTLNKVAMCKCVMCLLTANKVCYFKLLIRYFIFVLSVINFQNEINAFDNKNEFEF